VCFSAEADLVAGVVVGAVGIDAIRHVRRPAEWPLAAIPVVLAAHQLIEAVVWWGLEGHVARDVWRVAMWAYLLIAYAVLPVLVPIAVAALEPETNRRRLGVFLAIGVVVSIVLLHALVVGPADVTVDGRHLAYAVDVWRGGLVVALYVVATCGSMLLSSHRHVRWFGAVNLVAVVVLAWTEQNAVISLWCFWAAITSVAIAAHLRRDVTPPARVLVAPPGPR
jgi:hypothetical protein